MTGNRRFRASILLAAGMAGALQAATCYVATNGTSVSPFNSWQTAATNIHDAVALAGSGDAVLVGDGAYRLTNTLVVAANLSIQSANGPAGTTLYRDAAAGNFGLFTISQSGALVAGFTLTNGYLASGNGSGVKITAGTVSNCVIAKCGTSVAGGNDVDVSGSAVVVDSTITSCSPGQNSVVVVSAGVVRRCRIYSNTGGTWTYAIMNVSGSGRLENSLVSGNTCTGSSNPRGCVYLQAGSVVNCTIAGNSSTYSAGDGVYQTGGVLTNCIVYGNGTGAATENYYGAAGAAWYSCAPELTAGAQGNVAADPRFANAAQSDYRLALGSPCIDTGTNLAAITTDLELRSRPLAGDSRGTQRHDMGAYEKDGAAGALAVGFSGTGLSGMNSATGVFTAAVSGANTTIAWWGWDWNNDGVYDLTGAGLAVATNIFGLGRYTVTVSVSNSAGETATSTLTNYVLVVSSDIHVSVNGGNVAPYATWADAATNLNDAVSMALPGCTVWVSNGSYRITKKLDLFSGFAVRGVNGPDVTTVWRDASAGTFGLFDLRDAGALVCGLTMTNGSAPSGVNGSGINITAGLASNCVIAKCSNSGSGGDVYLSGGRMSGCIVSNNSALYEIVDVSGSAIIEDSTIIACAPGDSSMLKLPGGVVRRCRIRNNTGTAWTAGAVNVSGGQLENCLVSGNVGGASRHYAGGVYLTAGRVLNCTIVSNSLYGAGGDGVYRTGGVLTNCIVYGNGSGAAGENYTGAVSAVWYSCAQELTAGAQGNITSDPLFKNAPAGDFHLAYNSPCFGAGTNFAGIATLDLDLQPRVRSGGAVDMGAYELPLQSGPLVTFQ